MKLRTDCRDEKPFCCALLLQELDRRPRVIGLYFSLNGVENDGHRTDCFTRLDGVANERFFVDVGSCNFDASIEL